MSNGLNTIENGRMSAFFMRCRFFLNANHTDNFASYGARLEETILLLIAKSKDEGWDDISYIFSSRMECPEMIICYSIWTLLGCKGLAINQVLIYMLRYSEAYSQVKYYFSNVGICGNCCACCWVGYVGQFGGFSTLEIGSFNSTSASKPIFHRRSWA